MENRFEAIIESLKSQYSEELLGVGQGKGDSPRKLSIGRHFLPRAIA